MGWCALPLVLACSGTGHGKEPRAPGPAAPPIAEALLAGATELATAEYVWFHQHPELANQERETAARLATTLEGLGLEVHSGIGGHGIVALLQGQKPGTGPTVLYRADMDGLRVSEQTKLPHPSLNPGVMHACGHDVHMATAVGVLRVMAETRRDWSGTIVFVGQPAEEIGAGARQMLADPAFGRLLDRVGKPRVAFALHDAADVPAGQVAVSAGYVSATVDSVDMTLHGRGGHGAKPDQTVDPIVMASEVVLQLQTIVSRRITPGKRAVVTVGKLQAGESHNVIPASAELLLTVRSYEPEVRKLLLEEIEHIARHVAQSYHAPRPPTITVRAEPTPAGFNDEGWSRRLAARFTALLGPGRVVDAPPSMGGDDFARFSLKLGIPSVYYRLGAVDAAAFARRDREPLPSLHSDQWAPDARTALPIGIATMVAALREGLSAED